MAKLNRYQATIEKIFFDHYRAGSKEFEFDREELEDSYVALGFSRIKNIGDIPYSFRYRNALPDSVLDTRGPEWAFYQESQERFGGDEIIVVALPGDP